jgi:hypothetical protein
MRKDSGRPEQDTAGALPGRSCMGLYAPLRGALKDKAGVKGTRT